MDLLDISSFSVSALVGSLIFSVIGLYVYRLGKKASNSPQVYVGVSLMIYSYFTPTALLTWGAGIALCGAAYYYRD